MANLEDLIDPEYGLQQDEWSLARPRFVAEGQLEVIGWSGRLRSRKLYIVKCVKCALDTVLFGGGYFRGNKGNLERGKLTGTMEGMKQSDEANAETGLLNENLARDFDDQATEILVEDETMLLDGNAKTAPLDSANAITIKLIDSVKIIHTEEVI